MMCVGNNIQWQLKTSCGKIYYETIDAAIACSGLMHLGLLTHDCSGLRLSEALVHTVL
jgi:hypothetical protein